MTCKSLERTSHPRQESPPMAPSNALLAKAFLLVFSLIVVALFLIKAPLTPSVARMQERVLQNNIKKDVPIKLNIKKEKEKSFKDLNNGKWVTEFELELTNTGDKPIYFVYLVLTSDVQLGGNPVGVWQQAGVGRHHYQGNIGRHSRKPGETHVFTIHPGQMGWERAVSKGEQPDATRLEVDLQIQSFGDGHGYFNNTPHPSSPGKIATLE